MFDLNVGNEPFASPMWVIRGLPAAATLLLVVSFFSGTHQAMRETCDGAALGMLIAFSACTFSIKRIEFKEVVQPSDVDNISIT